MWYLTEKCSPLENLIPNGDVFNNVNTTISKQDNPWEILSEVCCTSVPGAP